MIPIAEDACKCYCFHRQWGFPYSVVLCGNLTIPNYEKYFHCFLFVAKVKLRHSPGRPSRSDFVQSEFVAFPVQEIAVFFIIESGTQTRIYPLNPRTE